MDSAYIKRLEDLRKTIENVKLKAKLDIEDAEAALRHAEGECDHRRPDGTLADNGGMFYGFCEICDFCFG